MNFFPRQLDSIVDEINALYSSAHNNALAMLQNLGAMGARFHELKESTTAGNFMGAADQTFPHISRATRNRAMQIADNIDKLKDYSRVSKDSPSIRGFLKHIQQSEVNPVDIRSIDLDEMRSGDDYARRVADEKAAEQRAYKRTVSQLEKTISDYGVAFVQKRVDDKAKALVLNEPKVPDFSVDECRKVLQILKHKAGWEDVQIRFQMQLALAKRQTGAA